MAKKTYAEMEAERDELSGLYARAITNLNDLEQQRDTLKAAAKDALFVLERLGIEHELQERLQVAICNFPKGNEEAENGQKD